MAPDDAHPTEIDDLLDGMQSAGDLVGEFSSARTTAGLPLDTVANRTGLDVVMVWDFEHGRYNPTVGDLALLLEGADCEMSVTVDGTTLVPDLAESSRDLSPGDLREARREEVVRQLGEALNLSPGEDPRLQHVAGFARQAGVRVEIAAVPADSASPSVPGGPELRPGQARATAPARPEIRTPPPGTKRHR